MLTSNKNLNFATQSRWICKIPINTLFPSLPDDFSLNLTKFTVPEMEFKTATMNYGGYNVDLPAGIINSDTKRLTINYLLNSNFVQYLTLLKWMERIAAYQTLITSNNNSEKPGVLLDWRLPVNITLLSEFKQPLLNIKYSDCWIVGFGALDMDYQAEDTPILHSFTLAYTDFKLTEVLNI
jgi:hypothetical protein